MAIETQENERNGDKSMGNYNREIELKWLEVWEKEQIYKFEENNDNVYVIDSPPPFTSGKLHMGHMLSFTMFDIAARYKRMKGYNVLYAQGWDTQGFPTEVKVEAKYGKLPREEFIKRCIEWTDEHIAYMRWQAKRFGFSADWDREYITYKPDYHKKIQLSLIMMYKNGLIYREEHPVFFCTNCVSAIAKAETEDKEREAKIYDVVFELDGKPFIIATTRPELIHAVVAIAVNPNDERYRNLEGKYVITPIGKKVPLIYDNDVDMDFGTGAVMIATFGDKQDVIWFYRHKLNYIKAMDENGFIINSGVIDGIHISEAKKSMVEWLKQKNLIVGERALKQVVKLHDRCKQPVEILMSKQWFAKLMDHKKGIEKVAREIKWYPDFGIYYLLDWLNTLEWDWVISRQRYWGTPLPFYYCESCNETQAAEEHELPFYPEKASNKTCKKCKGKMIPEQATADVWIDSSITPLIIAGWPEKGWEKLYPSDLRPQGIEIVRTWAFYTVYRCYMLTGKRPFKAILLNGNVLGPDGRKMSKSLGNVIDPMQLVDQYSADAARLWVALSGNLEKDKPFNYQQIKRAHSLVVKLWNAARFILMHADAENIKHIMEKNMKLEPIDMAIIEKLKMTSQKINNSMESFDYYNAITALTDFFWLDFCDTYIEIVKKRLKENKNKEEALYTLSYVFQNIIKLYAPFAPFITEELYRNAFANEGSIHKKHYPYFDSYNYAYVHYFDMMKKALSMIRKKTKEIQDKGKINLEIHKNREKNEILIILNGEEEHISVDNEILNEIEKNGLIEKAKHELNYLIK